MFSKLKKLFETNPSGDTRDPHLAHLAATALLLEVCHADHYEDPDEINSILNTAQTTFSISDDEIEQFFSDAELSKHDATSLYEFTDVINGHYDEKQKYNLICELWRVAYADGSLDRYEDHMIRKIAELIYVSHAEFIKAKLHIAESSS